MKGGVRGQSFPLIRKQLWMNELTHWGKARIESRIETKNKTSQDEYIERSDGLCNDFQNGGNEYWYIIPEETSLAVEKINKRRDKGN